MLQTGQYQLPLKSTGRVAHTVQSTIDNSSIGLCPCLLNPFAPKPHLQYCIAEKGKLGYVT